MIKELNISQKNKKGFTIVELLLYIGIVSVIVFSLSIFVTLVISVRTKNQTVLLVEQEGAAIMQNITQTIRNSSAINQPLAGATGATLSLEELNSSLNPTVFDLSNGALRIKEGTSQPIDLSSSMVTVSGLSFSNLTRTGTFGTVRVQFTISRNNPNNRNEYDYSQIFYGTASIRF